jgi:hypothetical protein
MAWCSALSSRQSQCKHLLKQHQQSLLLAPKLTHPKIPIVGFVRIELLNLDRLAPVKGAHRPSPHPKGKLTLDWQLALVVT